MAACVRQPVVHLAVRQSAEPRTIASSAVKRWRRRPTRSPASSRGGLRKDPGPPARPHPPNPWVGTRRATPCLGPLLHGPKQPSARDLSHHQIPIEPPDRLAGSRHGDLSPHHPPPPPPPPHPPDPHRAPPGG